MLDISKLEHRWLKYKIKSILPYAAILAVIIISIITFSFLMFNKTTTIPMVTSKKEDLKVKTPVPVPSINDENSMLLEPSMQFLQSMSGSTPLVESVHTTPVPVVPIKRSLPLAQVQAQTDTVPPIVKPPQVPVVKGKLTSIKRDDAAFDIHELEERFKNNSNPNLGLYIARYHYDHGNYTESYNYALKTNAISSTMEESWLIFAKSLVKLGKEDQAKKTLQLYISNSNSQSAKNYLDTLSKESSK
ncbi:MAG: hypothetical protein B7Y30_01465 [Campylobacterales bacterium 16-40-21]|nr:MAG: hypothetical protein B7Y30_01465 [Campylobacterales bacterium 16-40-21]